MKPELAARLDSLVAEYGPDHLAGDPLSVVRPYRSRADREVSGLIAAGLAFGAAPQVIRSARSVLDALGPHPANAIRDPERLRRLAGFRHRWVTGEDLARLLGLVATIQRESGSLQAFFLQGCGREDRDIGPGLSSFSSRLRELAGPSSRGFRFLLPDPATGAAKRLCLFLRWMVRPDEGLDLGQWKRVDPAALVMPLDTHVLRISRYIGLTERRTATFATAREITRSLAALCPGDPVRYDFAIAQLGISKGCLHRRDEAACGVCPLRDICRV